MNIEKPIKRAGLVRIPEFFVRRAAGRKVRRAVPAVARVCTGARGDPRAASSSETSRGEMACRSVGHRAGRGPTTELLVDGPLHGNGRLGFEVPGRSVPDRREADVLVQRFHRVDVHDLPMAADLERMLDLVGEQADLPALGQSAVHANAKEARVTDARDEVRARPDAAGKTEAALDEDEKRHRLDFGDQLVERRRLRHAALEERLQITIEDTQMRGALGGRTLREDDRQQDDERRTASCQRVC